MKFYSFSLDNQGRTTTIHSGEQEFDCVGEAAFAIGKEATSQKEHVIVSKNKEVARALQTFCLLLRGRNLDIYEALKDIQEVQGPV